MELEPLQLAEPAGLAIAGGKMYVADTNNHRIVVVDLATKKANELVIAGLSSPRPADVPQTIPSVPNVKTIDINRQELSAASAIDIQVDFSLPKGFKLNELLPVTYTLKADGEQTLIPADHLDVKHESTTEGTTTKMSIATSRKTGEATLILSITYGYCRDGNGGVCKVATSHWKIPVILKDGANGKLVKLQVTAK